MTLSADLDIVRTMGSVHEIRGGAVMSNQEYSNSTKRWHWTDDLARALADAGHPTNRALLEWMATPVAVRGEGEPLAVAEALLGADDEDPSLAA